MPAATQQNNSVFRGIFDSFVASDLRLRPALARLPCRPGCSKDRAPVYS